jgi:hypothetical protein
MTETDIGTGITITTICNYDKYQADGNEAETATETAPGHPQRLT